MRKALHDSYNGEFEYRKWYSIEIDNIELDNALRRWLRLYRVKYEPSDCTPYGSNHHITHYEIYADIRVAEAIDVFLRNWWEMDGYFTT